MEQSDISLYRLALPTSMSLQGGHSSLNPPSPPTRLANRCGREFFMTHHLDPLHETPLAARSGNAVLSEVRVF
jgi:hypothetical protein